MAESDVQREGEYESRLRRDRLASRRSPDDVVGPATWQPPPPVAEPPPRPDIGSIARQQGMEERLNRTRREERAPEERPPEGGGGPSLRQAAMLAKANPAGLAASTGIGLATGQTSPKQLQQMMGRGCVRGLWSFLWPSFGHTIYLLGIIFYAAWASKFARKYLPQIGEEWFPPEMLKQVPKDMLIPVKVGELIGMMFILFFVFIFDMLCIGILAFFLALILSVT